MKTLRVLLHILLVPTNLVVMFLLLVAAFSDRVSPDRSILVAYIGLGFPIWFVFNSLFAFCWIFLREWKYLIVSIAVFAVCWNPITKYFPYHAPVSAVPQENTLKVLTYNVMHFGNQGHTAKLPNKMVAFIAGSGADIVCLQEYSVVTSGDGLTAEALREALSMYPYHSVIPLSTTPDRVSGLALFSKYPITASRQIRYESEYNGSSVHELDVKGKKLYVFNNHLESFRLTREDRSQYYSLIRTFGSDGIEDMRGTLQQKIGPAFRKRAKQAEAVAAEIKKVEGSYVLVCGDFNDTPISYAHYKIQGDMLDAFEESGKGSGATYNQNFFWFRIDHIIYSSNMKAFNCTVGNDKFSDHYPLWCYLQLN